MDCSNKNNDKMLSWCIYNVCRSKIHGNNSKKKGNSINADIVIRGSYVIRKLGDIKSKVRDVYFNPDKITTM